MKILKVLLGFFLLYTLGQEYAKVVKQLDTFFTPGVLLGACIVLVLVAWLFGSAFSIEKLKIRSYPFLKAYLISLLGFALAAFISLSTYQIPDDTVRVEGLEIPIGEFMEGSRRIVPDLAQRKAYCECIVRKMVASPDILSEYRAELEKGKIDIIIEAMKQGKVSIDTGLETCIDSIQFSWTPVMIESMENSCKDQEFDPEFVRSHDSNAYCECVINEYQKHPVDTISQGGFFESELYQQIDEYCSLKSLREAPLP